MPLATLHGSIAIGLAACRRLAPFALPGGGVHARASADPRADEAPPPAVASVVGGRGRIDSFRRAPPNVSIAPALEIALEALGASSVFVIDANGCPLGAAGDSHAFAGMGHSIDESSLAARILRERRATLLAGDGRLLHVEVLDRMIAVFGFAPDAAAPSRQRVNAALEEASRMLAGAVHLPPIEDADLASLFGTDEGAPS